MRHFWILYAVLFVLLILAFTAGGQTLPRANSQFSSSTTQALPDAPEAVPPDTPSAQPTQAPDSAWFRIQRFANGQPIVVYSTYGPPMHCRFAGATTDYLFCDPPNSPAGTGYRFERASVVNVTVSHEPRNWHPAWLSSMIAGGLVVGLIATRSTDAGTAAEAGLVGAGVVGLIGAPLAFLPHPQAAFVGPGYPQYGVGIPVNFPIRSRLHTMLLLQGLR
jgi:hypothetical protein